MADFLHELTFKENLPASTRALYILNLCYLVEDVKGKSFKNITAQDVELYLQGHYRPQSQDPKQKWISTHNVRCIMYLRFFKWLYYPQVARKQRPKPDVVRNIHVIAKPEVTNVEAKDLWTPEMDRIFLKYCQDPRMCWYHTASDDTSGRPSEILCKRFSDVKVKTFGGKMYAEMEIGRGGKTNSRVVPLLRSLPYYKQLAARNTDPQSFIFRSERRGFRERNKSVSVSSLYGMYERLKKEYFPSLLRREEVPEEDKAIIAEMLEKPWNPYIRRHTALTEKAKYLNDYSLRLHAGWKKGSKMAEVYTHELGGESSRAILSQHGILPSDTQLKKDMLEPRYCPNCKEPNKPDARFCVKQGCGHPLTFEVVKEMQAREAEKERQAEENKQKLDEVYEALYKAGIIKKP